MALATYLGVVSLTLILRLTLGEWTRSWPLLVSNLFFNAFVVAGLTWIVTSSSACTKHFSQIWTRKSSRSGGRIRPPPVEDVRSTSTAETNENHVGTAAPGCPRLLRAK